MSEDVPPYGPMSYVFRCQACGSAPYTVDHAELQPLLADRLFGMTWQCPDCHGWTQIRVAMPNGELTVAKSAAPAVRTS